MSAPRSSRGLGSLLVGLVIVLVLGVGTVYAASPTEPVTADPTPLIPADRGVFTPTGSMQETREHPTATLLQDGRVLVIGGYGASDLAEVWDPDTGTFSPAGTLPHGRYGHTATLLPDGRVLVTGGVSTDGDPEFDAQASAAIWDPDSMRFVATGSPARARWGGTATVLSDGRVLVRGGMDLRGEAPVTVAEVWDPETGIFGPADSIPEAGDPDGTLLDNGRILVFQRGRASVWDPTTGSSTPAGSRTPDYLDWFTATLLQDGRVLVAGGGGCQPVARPSGGLSVCPVAFTRTAEIWDPATLSFSPTGPLIQARYLHTAALLDDGRVLLVGDRIHGRAGTAEVFELTEQAPTP